MILLQKLRKDERNRFLNLFQGKAFVPHFIETASLTYGDKDEVRVADELFKGFLVGLSEYEQSKIITSSLQAAIESNSVGPGRMKKITEALIELISDHKPSH